jgi:hypothetical protein
VKFFRKKIVYCENNEHVYSAACKKNRVSAAKMQYYSAVYIAQNVHDERIRPSYNYANMYRKTVSGNWVDFEYYQILIEVLIKDTISRLYRAMRIPQNNI